MKRTAETHHPVVTPRELTICRVIAGVFGFAFLALVAAELLRDEFRYALVEWGNPGRWVIYADDRSAAVRTLQGKMFALLSFGAMGAAAVAFAYRPRWFTQTAVVAGWVALILLSFIGLRLSR